MLGLRVRLHDRTGEDLGTATVPGPVAIGDRVATEGGEYRVMVPDRPMSSPKRSRRRRRIAPWNSSRSSVYGTADPSEYS
jgi:hypothetical protein